MTTYIKSINRKIWKVVETKIEIEDPENPTEAEKYFSKIMTLLEVLFMMQLMKEHLSKSRILRWLMKLGRNWKNHLRVLKP